MAAGLFQQRSERDIAEACSATFKAVVISAHKHLPAHILADSSVEALLDAWDQQGREQRELADRRQEEMEAHAAEVMEGLSEIGRDR